MDLHELKSSLEVLEDFLEKIHKYASHELALALERSIKLMDMEIAREEARAQKLKNL